MKLRSEGQEGARVQGPGRGNSKSKGPEVGRSLARSRSNKRPGWLEHGKHESKWQGLGLKEQMEAGHVGSGGQLAALLLGQELEESIRLHGVNGELTYDLSAEGAMGCRRGRVPRGDELGVGRLLLWFSRGGGSRDQAWPWRWRGRLRKSSGGRDDKTS